MRSRTLMTPALWKHEYTIGHPTLDQHHMRMLELIEEIGEAIQNASETGARQAVTDLLHYTIVHHDEEERLLELAGYPALHEHQVSHRRMKEHVRTCQIQMRHGSDALAMAPGIQSCMQDWLHHHILKEDQLFAAWLQTSPPGSTLTRLLPLWLRRRLHRAKA